MISIRKLIQKEYENISEFVKNEDFVLRFKFETNEKLLVSVLHCDPVTKELEEVHSFYFCQNEYLEKYEKEKDFKDAIIANPEYFFV